jgi:LysR family hydrogen peroxide-inducible transcriptional activator
MRLPQVMELYQIRYFLAVADTLNFTRASERSYVSQPALTKAIQRLEDTIGGRLFDRSKNAVQLTTLGEEMLPNLRQIYDAAQLARDKARSLTGARKDIVRVGVMCTIDFQQLLPGFADAQQAAVELVFREGNLEALTDALDRGEIDIGIMCSPHETPKRFGAATLFREDYVLAFGDDHRFQGRDRIEMQELDREHYCERIFCEFTHHIERLLLARNVRLEVVHQSSREDWIQAFVRSNFGVAFMPVSIARAAALSHALTADCPIVREVKVLTASERAATPSQQAVVQTLLAHDWSRTDQTLPSLVSG